MWANEWLNWAYTVNLELMLHIFESQNFFFFFPRRVEFWLCNASVEQCIEQESQTQMALVLHEAVSG